MPSIPGRLGLVKIGGTPTAFTDEAVNVLTTNKKYQIANTSKRIWSPTATITVKAAGVAVDPVADPYAINRLTGIVTFTNVSARGTVTISGTYLPMSTVAKSKSVTFDHGNEVLDDTTFDSNGYEENIPGIHSIGVSLGRNWEATYAAVFKTAILSGTLLVLEVYHDRNGSPNLIAWLRPTKQAISIATRSIIGEDLTFVGSADADLRVVSTQ
jgi:hypothetical protein